ncbi:Mo25-like protein, partial [Nadsonia fulvescens var. elongata DSM 6958]
MSFLFSRNKQKTPQDLVRTLYDQLPRLDNTSERRKLIEDVSRNLASMKLILHGDETTDPVPDQIALLAQEVYSTDLLILLVKSLPYLEFDSRKDVSVVFTTLLRRQIGNRSPTVDYLASKPQIFDHLIASHENSDIVLNIGSILRDCIKHQVLAKIIIWGANMWNFFDFLDNGAFENVTDAFTTLLELLSLPENASDWLAANHATFINKMGTLMNSKSYITKRQSLKLMSQLICERKNYTLMFAYVNDPENLKQIMILLRDKSKSIQSEAFNIFKIFVANPKKTKPVYDILVKNKFKLIEFLERFNIDKPSSNGGGSGSTQTEMFNEEKRFVLKQI